MRKWKKAKLFYVIPRIGKLGHSLDAELILNDRWIGIYSTGFD